MVPNFVSLVLVMVCGVVAITSSCPDSCQCQPGTMTCQNLTSLPDSPPADTVEFIFENCKFTTIAVVPYTQAVSLIIDDTPVDTISDSAFQGLQKLEYLRISRAPITTISPAMFEGLVSVTRLELEALELGALPPAAFATMPTLQRLDLTANPSLHIADDAFSGVHLKELICQQCGLTSIPAPVLSHSSLRMLDLSYNSLTTLAKHTFTSLMNVTTLKLAHSGLTHLEPDSLDGLHALTDLWLNGNKLTTIQSDRFKDFQQTIKTVRLNHNQLRSLSVSSQYKLSIPKI